jgi:hypothetical protein
VKVTSTSKAGDSGLVNITKAVSINSKAKASPGDHHSLYLIDLYSIEFVRI